MHSKTLKVYAKHSGNQMHSSHTGLQFVCHCRVACDDMLHSLCMFTAAYQSNLVKTDFAAGKNASRKEV